MQVSPADNHAFVLLHIFNGIDTINFRDKDGIWIRLSMYNTESSLPFYITTSVSTTIPGFMQSHFTNIKICCICFGFNRVSNQQRQDDTLQTTLIVIVIFLLQVDGASVVIAKYLHNVGSRDTIQS